MCQCLFLPPPSPAWPQAAGNWTVEPGPLTSQVQETIRTRDAAKQRARKQTTLRMGGRATRDCRRARAAVILPTAPPVQNPSSVRRRRVPLPARYLLAGLAALLGCEQRQQKRGPSIRARARLPTTREKIARADARVSGRWSFAASVPQPIEQRLSKS